MCALIHSIGGLMKIRTKVLAVALAPAIAIGVAIVHSQGDEVTWVEVLLLTAVLGLIAGAVAGFVVRDIKDSKGDDPET